MRRPCGWCRGRLDRYVGDEAAERQLRIGECLHQLVEIGDDHPAHRQAGIERIAQLDRIGGVVVVDRRHEQIFLGAERRVDRCAPDPHRRFEIADRRAAEAALPEQPRRAVEYFLVEFLGPGHPEPFR